MAVEIVHRFDVVQQQARALIQRLSTITDEQCAVFPGTIARIYVELDRYDQAILDWFLSSAPWEEAYEVTSIAAFILVLKQDLQ